MRTIYGTPIGEFIDESCATDDVQIFGGGGNDFINGGTGNDELIGGAGDDKLNGFDGDDWLWGGDGVFEDPTKPDQGNDILRGEYGNDHLFGQSGNDILEGGEGHDELNGGRGDDKITGGWGHDRMWGDAGKDQFIFNHSIGANNQLYCDSSLNAQSMDEIFDFVSGQDQIAFRGMASADAANYGELDMFPGASYADVLRVGTAIIASGKTYAFVADGNDGYLFADQNGDGVVDMGVQLHHLHNTSMFAPTDLIGL
jgi:Ca2+-binding RTX toxin-like protein